MGEFSLSDNQLFMKKQIDNTISIINKFFDDKELSYTALQNALLSLVLLPYESAKKRDKTRLWQGKYEDIKNTIGFNDEVFTPIAECKDGKVKFNNRTQYSFIKKFRNAIAHQNIRIVVDENRFISIKFFNVFPASCSKCKAKECKAKCLQRVNGGLEDFRISFTYNQLHAFALYIANSYLRSITGEMNNQTEGENKNGKS